ncbi:MAG: hypothetical protein KDK70_26190, partial [Myxococcales bacterium]|nr:hypothetical protein [Myxococcales bacterium]
MGTKTIDTPAIDYVEDAARWAAAGRPDHAANLYAIALDLRPDDWDVRMKLAACLASSERPEAAAAHYVEIAGHYAAQRSLHEALAVAHHILQLHAESFGGAALGRALQAIGLGAAPLCRKAVRVHREQGRDDLAAELLQLCARLDPRDVEPWRELAQLYIDHQMLPESIHALRAATQHLRAAGNLALYVDFARTILWLDPHDLQILRELPQVFLRMGQPQQAVVELSTLLRVSPGDLVGYETLAHAFAAIGRKSVCVSVLEQLTRTLKATGRPLEADAIIERACAWRPDDPELRQRVAALRDLQPSGPIYVDDRARPTTDDGTVVLSIADLTRSAAAEAAPDDDETFDATELVELVDQEESVVLRLSDLSRVQRSPVRADPPGREPLAYGEAPKPTTTQVLDLRDIQDVLAEGNLQPTPLRGDTLQGLIVPRPWVQGRLGAED